LKAFELVRTHKLNANLLIDYDI